MTSKIYSQLLSFGFTHLNMEFRMKVDASEYDFVSLCTLCLDLFSFVSIVVFLFPFSLFSVLQKNNHRALMVLKQMERANLKPDSETYSYLIANCECEEDIVKVSMICR